MTDWNDIQPDEVIASCSVCKQTQCNLECPWLDHYRALPKEIQTNINDIAFGRKDGKSNNRK